MQTHRSPWLVLLAAVLLSLSAVACAPPWGSAYAPRSAVDFHPHEASYELLGRVSSSACGTNDFVKEYVDRSTDKWHGHHRYLYEVAKVQALDGRPEADLLLFVRAIEKVKDGQYCVTVSGHAARLTGLRATAWSPSLVGARAATARGNSLLSSPDLNGVEDLSPPEPRGTGRR